MIYLASPYTSPDRELKLRRVALVEEAIASLHYQNVVVYSPIVHWHYVAERLGLATDFKPWLTQNNGMMDAASVVGVLRIDGWEASKGVCHELRYAALSNTPIEAFDLINGTCVSGGLLDASELPQLA